MLGNLPSVGHIAGQAATGCILHDQSQVRLCQHCFKGIDDVDMPLPEIRLNLQPRNETLTSIRLLCTVCTVLGTGLRCSCLLILCENCRLAPRTAALRDPLYSTCGLENVKSQKAGANWRLTTISLRMFCSNTFGIGRFMSLIATSSFVFLSSARYVSPVPPAVVSLLEKKHLGTGMLPERVREEGESCNFPGASPWPSFCLKA